MGKGTLQIIHDDADLLAQARAMFEREGYEVLCSSSAEAGASLAVERRPDAVILGQTARIDGLGLCRRLRADPRTLAVPVVILTAGNSEEERVAALEAGADDSVARPFSPRELIARMRAVIRRSAARSSPEEILQVGELTVDVARHQVTFRGKAVSLTAAEFRILRFMAARPGRVLSRSEIIEGALGGAVDGMSRTIDVHLASIRRKLGRGGPSCIETVRGVGYRVAESTAAVGSRSR